MAATVEAQIAVRIRALVEGLASVAAFSDGLKSITGVAGRTRAGLTATGQTFRDVAATAEAESARVKRAVDQIAAAVKKLRREANFTSEFTPDKHNPAVTQAQALQELSLLDLTNPLKAFTAEADGAFAKLKALGDARRATQEAETADRLASARAERAALDENHARATAHFRDLADKRRAARDVTLREELAASARVADALTGDTDKAIKANQSAIQRLGELTRRNLRDDAVKNFERSLRNNVVAGHQFGGVLKALGFVGEGSFNLLRRAAAPFLGIVSQMIRQVQFLIGSLLLFAASSPFLAFGLLVKEGLAWNAELEHAKLAITALIQETNELYKADGSRITDPLEQFAAAGEIAGRVVTKLRIASLDLNATSEDLINVFNQTFTAAAHAGIGAEEYVGLLHTLVAAADAVKIPFEQVGTGIRLLLNGTARETSRLAPALFGSAKAANEFVRAHRAAGDLLPALTARLKVFELAATKNAQTFRALASNTLEVFQLLSGAATSGLFNQLKDTFADVIARTFDLKAGKMRDELNGVAALAYTLLTRAGELGRKVVNRIIDGIIVVSRYIQANGQYVADIIDLALRIVGVIGGIILDILTIFSDLDRVRKSTHTWKEVLEGILKLLVIIRVGVNLIIGGFEVLSGVVSNQFNAALRDSIGFVDAIVRGLTLGALNLSSITGGASDFLIQQAQAGAARGTALAGAGVSRLRNIDGALVPLLPGSKLFGGVGGAPSLASAFTGLSSRLKRPGPGGGEGGKGRGARGDNRLADAQRELADSRIDLALARLEARVSRVKFLMDKAQDVLDDRLEDRLISIADFFRLSLEAQRTALNADITEQIAARNADRLRAQNKITELNAKAAAAKDPKEAEAFRVQAQAERVKLTEKEVKYTERIAQLTGDIADAERKSNVALTRKLELLRDAQRDVQAQFLDTENRPADAERIRIAAQFKDTLRDSLKEFDKELGSPINDVISDINTLGAVTSDEFRRMAVAAGIDLSKLSAETRRVLALMDRLAARSDFSALQQGVETQRDRLREAIRGIELDLAEGVIGSRGEADSQIVDAIAKANAEIDTLYQKIIALLALDPNNPALLAFIRTLENDIREAKTEVNTLGQEINGSLRDAAGSFVDDLIDDSGSVSEAFASLAKNILRDITAMVIKATILQKVFDLLGLNGENGTTGPGGVLSRLLNFANIPKRERGGPVTAGQPYIVGERRAELFVPNQSGRIVPRVTALDDALALGAPFARGVRGGSNAGGGSGARAAAAAQPPPTVIVALNEDDIANASMSSRGNDVWLYHFNRNKKALGLA